MRDFTQRKQSKTHTKPRIYSRQLHTPQHTQDQATGDVARSSLKKHCTEQESCLLQKKVKPCSQDTGKPYGHRVEVPQHNETTW